MSDKPERTSPAAEADTAAEQATAQPSAEAGNGGPAAADVEQLKGELEAAKAQAAEHLDKSLRARAEAENTRRRSEIDLAHAHKYAIERFAAELLAVRDSLELARTVDIDQESQTALAKMHEGLDLTLKQMDDVFRKFGLVVLDPRGERFDPEKHHAISVIETTDVPANHVVNVMQKGCLLNERVLRPAMVVVARAPADSGKAGGDAGAKA